MGIRDSFRVLFKILNILPLISQHIFHFVVLVVNNKNQFRMNSEIHSINTRNNSNFHQSLSHFTIYQKVPPPEIKDLPHNIKKFSSSLRRFLHKHSFYTVEEYINYKAVV